MEKSGCEAPVRKAPARWSAATPAWPIVGTASMTECVQIARWIANSVSTPVIMDGDTGHGGIMAVRRMIRECIHAGVAGIRIDDQPIEGKRRTQSAGLEVDALEQAIVRYRAAVDAKNELDPNFVVHGTVLRARRGEWRTGMTQCSVWQPIRMKRASIGCSLNHPFHR